MGCQCAKKSEEELEDELKKDSIDGINEEIKGDNNPNNKNDVYGINEEGNNREMDNENKLKNPNEDDEEYLERINEEKNAKYGDYPDRMLEIINRIREDPASYAEYIEDCIKNIMEESDKNDETKTKLIYKKK